MARAFEIGFVVALVGCSVVPNPDYEQAEGTTSDATTSGEESSTSGSDDTPTDFVCGFDEEPEALPCPPECDVCSGSVCRFDCLAEGDCRQAIVTCPDGWHCAVSCTGHHACERATIVCPAGERCEVACAGDRACERLALRCGGGTCGLACGEGPEACRDARMHCGTNDGVVACLEAQQGLVVEPDAMSGCGCAAEDACAEDDD